MNAALALTGANGVARVVHSPEDAVGDYGAIEVLDLENLDYASIEYGKLSPTAGKAAVEWILRAGELAAAGRVQASRPAPINKEACSLAGFSDVGHMETIPEPDGCPKRWPPC